MRTLNAAIVGLSTALLNCTLAAPAQAQSIRSELAAQARASIGISVSVRPSFVPGAAGDPLAMTSNLPPQVRYAVVQLAPERAVASDPAGGQALHQAAALAGNRSGLLLIVPD